MASDLPPGWVEKLDEKTGKTYFVNRYFDNNPLGLYTMMSVVGRYPFLLV